MLCLFKSNLYRHWDNTKSIKIEKFKPLKTKTHETTHYFFPKKVSVHTPLLLLTISLMIDLLLLPVFSFLEYIFLYEFLPVLLRLMFSAIRSFIISSIAFYFVWQYFMSTISADCSIMISSPNSIMSWASLLLLFLIHG